MSAQAPGPPHRTGEGRPLRGIPRSRAFWELKAEQMMNRIFDPEEPIDLAVEPQPQEPEPRDVSAAAAAAGTASVPTPAGITPAAGAPAPAPASRRSTPAADARRPRAVASRRPRGSTALSAASQAARRPDERLVLIGALCGVCMVSVAGSLLYFGYWNRLQQNLSQERNLLLVERLRSLGPANPSPVAGPEPAAPALPAPGVQAAGADGLPPPPPEEPWIQQLSTLPQTSSTPSRVLTVPVSPRLAAAAPAASGSSPAPAPAAPLPQLVGVVASSGRPASAIFLVSGNSTSVASGEQIGSSGWRLRSADGETALIERGGEVRQVSIISGNGF